MDCVPSFNIDILPQPALPTSPGLDPEDVLELELLVLVLVELLVEDVDVVVDAPELDVPAEVVGPEPVVVDPVEWGSVTEVPPPPPAPSPEPPQLRAAKATKPATRP
jgi:hypothetical protein